jgi:hypothetical protein
MSEKQFKNASSKAVAFWDFNEKPVFCGYFIKESKLENGDAVLVFKEDETGLIYNLNPSKGITVGLNEVVIPEVKEDKTKKIAAAPAVKLIETTFLIKISFIGKVKIKNNRTFRQYAIQYAEN